MLSYTGDKQITLSKPILRYNGNYCRICCKSIQIPTILLTSQVLELFSALDGLMKFLKILSFLFQFLENGYKYLWF